jgi:hypothetical protein
MKQVVSMSIFICWSGTRTRLLARAVCDLLESQDSLKGRVFFSDKIEKGVTWFESIIENLRDADAGVVCLTAENLESPWLHFRSRGPGAGDRGAGRNRRRDCEEATHSPVHVAARCHCGRAQRSAQRLSGDEHDAE